jgi:hypothetical protein
MFKNMRYNLSGINDVNVITYGRENIGGEEACKITQCFEMNMEKKNLPNDHHIVCLWKNG